MNNLGLRIFSRFCHLRKGALRTNNAAYGVRHVVAHRVSAYGLAIGCLATTGQAFSLEADKAVRVTPLGAAQHTWDGAAIAYPTGMAEVTGMLIELAPGAETGWHEHGVPSFAYILQGNLEIQLRDGRVNRVGPGQTVAEVVNTPHNGRNVGSEPVKLVVFYTGVTGASLSKTAPMAKHGTD